MVVLGGVLFLMSEVRLPRINHLTIFRSRSTQECTKPHQKSSQAEGVTLHADAETRSEHEKGQLALGFTNVSLKVRTKSKDWPTSFRE